MNRVIKDYTKIDKALQEEIYEAFSEGGLERTSFPFRGAIAEGVIYKGEDVTYLIPLSTVLKGKAGSAKDIDDEDEDDNDIDEVDLAGEEDTDTSDDDEDDVNPKAKKKKNKSDDDDDDEDDEDDDDDDDDDDEE